MAAEKDVVTTKDVASKDPAGRRTMERGGETREAAAEFARAGRALAEDVAKPANEAGDATVLTLQTGMESGTAANRTLTATLANSAGQVADEANRAAREIGERATRNMETFLQAQGIIAEGMQSVWHEWLEYSKTAWQRWAEQSQSMMRARTLPELVAAQSDMMRGEMEMMMRSGVRMAELTTRSASDVARSMAERVDMGVVRQQPQRPAA